MAASDHNSPQQFGRAGLPRYTPNPNAGTEDQKFYSRDSDADVEYNIREFASKVKHDIVSGNHKFIGHPETKDYSSGGLSYWGEKGSMAESHVEEWKGAVDEAARRGMSVAKNPVDLSTHEGREAYAPTLKKASERLGSIKRANTPAAKEAKWRADVDKNGFT